MAAREPEPLPAFSFPQLGSGSSQPSSPALSPNYIPSSSHRRTPSQLAADDNSDTATNSNSENPLPAAPPLPPPGPGLGARGPGRRGHAHRRSAAISSVDLTAVAKAFPSKPVAGSAPSTPADLKHQHELSEQASRPGSRSFPNLSAQSPSIAIDESYTNSQQSPCPRVEVNDHDVSSNPTRRPLSTISSEGSISTTRGNHSLNPSSISGSLPQPNQKPENTSTRPKTADPRFDVNPLAVDPDTPVSDKRHKRPQSVSALMAISTDAASQFDNSTTTTTTNTTTTDKPSAPDEEQIVGPLNLQKKRSPYSDPEPTTVPKARAKSTTEKKSNKKQKKVRSWAGILTRKARKRSKKSSSKKAPTPPPISTRPNAAGDESDVDFDDDNIVVLRTPTLPNAPPVEQPPESPNPPLSLEDAWKPRSYYEQGREMDLLSPVIDLDAALGPFNTPEMGTDRPASTSFSVATKRMYSGGRRGEFIGPEMRYHRRAESAPEMPPFDRSSLGLGRLGSNPDVFYEEEEDAFLAGSSKKWDDGSKSSQPTSVGSGDESLESRSSETVTPNAIDSDNEDLEASGLGIKVVDAAVTGPTHSPGNNSNSKENFGNGQSTSYTPNEPTTPESANMETSASQSARPGATGGDVEILEPEGWPTASGVQTKPAHPTLYDPHRRPATSPDLSTSALHIPKPSSHTDLPLPTEYSTFPSPNPSHVSFDARLPTASSSITDRQTFQSSGSVEPGADLQHGSVEDVPSLTSSASTMTGNCPRSSSTFYSRTAGDRATSFTAAAARRSSGANSHKRSSLVSLSKLVGASTGEKSKLSYEEKAPSDEPAEKTKKKTHRMSRLMHFWKSKEKGKGKTASQ